MIIKILIKPKKFSNKKLITIKMIKKIFALNFRVLKQKMDFPFALSMLNQYKLLSFIKIKELFKAKE